jgi:hypothetical protein
MIRLLVLTGLWAGSLVFNAGNSVSDTLKVDFYFSAGFILFGISGLLAFLLRFSPPSPRCFSCELFPFLWAESRHACFHTLPLGGFAAFSTHLTHHFGNKIASHGFIL